MLEIMQLITEPGGLANRLLYDMYRRLKRKIFSSADYFIVEFHRCECCKLKLWFIKVD